jgi:hypothetical protein
MNPTPKAVQVTSRRRENTDMAAGLEDFHLAEHSPYWLALRKLQPCSVIHPSKG